MPNGGVRNYITKPVYGYWAKDEKRFIIRTKDYGTLKVARVVCEAFHGPPPFQGAVTMHQDENSRNNKPGNLKWGTQKENLNAPGFLEYCRSRVGENSPYVKGQRNVQA